MSPAAEPASARLSSASYRPLQLDRRQEQQLQLSPPFANLQLLDQVAEHLPLLFDAHVLPDLVEVRQHLLDLRQAHLDRFAIRRPRLQVHQLAL